ncbi:MAG: sulfatase-like hydrolase/transferase [Chloroflexi bacterium]|nr:sulfatase-like hydrolase/transferase [Chloroflexota bacterium]
MRKLLTAGLLSLALVSGCTPGKETVPARPNILLIITDDQRYDTLGEFMPIVQARIFDQGIYFPNAYVTTPECCPSRSSILTGMYAHNHGVRANEDPLREPTLVEVLQTAGYFTGMVGKYLNSWDGSPRAEFDFWVAFSQSSSAYQRYLNPPLNVNGSWREQQGYSTYLLKDYALDFLRAAGDKDQPFFLIFAPNAPHAPATPPPPGRNLYQDLAPHRPPGYNEEDVSDKPSWLQALPLLAGESQEQLDRFRRRQLQTLQSVDQAIGEMLDLLPGLGLLEDTVIFYLSDNGRFWGEHRLGISWGEESGLSKGLVYEPAIRVPFALYYPRIVPQGRVEGRLVANIDIAPTIYELAGLPIPPEVDGRSLLSLLEGTEGWRNDLLIEGWPEGHPWAAVHTTRYVYVETEGDIAELYDLVEDPYQLLNRAYDPAYSDIVADMRQRLEPLRRD